MPSRSAGGCCCGTATKVPRFDHDAQLGNLQASLADIAAVRRTDCLHTCEGANVIVIQPSAEGRRAGGRPVWLGQANDTGVVADIAAWIDNGGPGIAELPGILELYAFQPPHQLGAELDDR